MFLFVITIETGDAEWAHMSEKAAKHDVARFFSDNYRKLVGYFRANYSDLSNMEAEDIVSDLMADLFEKMDIMGDVENLSAYVYRSIRNRASDYLRRRKKTVSYDAPASDDENGSGGETVPEPRYDREGEIEASEIRDRLSEALDQLEPDQRAVWIATELDGYSFRELAEEWGAPIGTLLARKHRANAGLQKKLKDLKKS
jgi:RNA polymerase sigma factor (sigma-70 family)